MWKPLHNSSAVRHRAESPVASALGIRKYFENSRRCILWLLVGILLAGYPSSSANAQTDERVTVRIDGRSVLRVGADTFGDASQRARRIEQRVGTLLEQPEAIGSVRVEPSGENLANRVVVASGVPIVTVSTTDAQDNLTTVDHLAAQWGQAVGRALTRAQSRRLSTGGRFVSEVQSSMEAALGRLTESAIRVIPRALAALLVLSFFWALAAIVRWLLRLLFHRFIEDLTIENLITQVGYYAMWVLGLIVAIDAFGIDPETVVTGLGLTSLALGFALKDILSNFVSGLLILTLRSFHLGDQIVVGDTEGSVERIELRATQIRTYDGRAVLVPNAELLTSRIINNTAGPVRRASVAIVLSHDVAISRVREVLKGAMQSVEGVLDTPAPSVRIRELTLDGIEFEGRFWTDSRRSDFLSTSSKAAEAILIGLKQDGIPIAPSTERLLVPGELAKWRSILK